MSFELPERWSALAAAYPDWTPGRIVLQEKGQYRLLTAAGEQAALVSGRFQYNAMTASDFPTVGDYVLADCSDADTAIIHQVLPRKSLFVRKAAGTAKGEQTVAANVDTVFLCMSLNHDFNLRRLERYLAIAWESGANPVIVLTKADLCPEPSQMLRDIAHIAMGADVLLTCAMAEDGYQQLLPYIAPGKTVAFVGSSGVGKSTLINRLLGEDRLATGGLRNDDRGHHTTTHRAMLFLPGGAMVIDTPGMRELGMWDSTSGVEQAFQDIEALAAACRFPRCTHTSEPGCAILAALEDGTLTPKRWQSYLRLMKESAASNRREDQMAAKEKKFKQIARDKRRLQQSRNERF